MTTPPDPFEKPSGDQPPPGYGPPPPGYGPPPPGYGQPAQSSTPLVLGIIGIVMAICCWPAGLVLGIISYVQAGKQPGGNKVVGIVAIVLSALNLVATAVMMSTGNGYFYYRTG